MPFSLSYNEAANPRAAPVRAWLTAAATAVTCQHSHTFHVTVKRQHINQKLNQSRIYVRCFKLSFALLEWLNLFYHNQISKSRLTHLR